MISVFTDINQARAEIEAHINEPYDFSIHHFRDGFVARAVRHPDPTMEDRPIYVSALRNGLPHWYSISDFCYEGVDWERDTKPFITPMEPLFDLDEIHEAQELMK